MDWEEEDEEEGPSEVFVGMAFGREGCEDVFGVINKKCEEYGLDALRAHPDQVVGSPTINDVLDELMERCELAIIDLTHERPSVHHEIGMVDGTFYPNCILLIAKKNTALFANIEGRIIHYYDDTTHLARILDRQLEGMIEAWSEEDEEEEDEDEDDDE